MKRVAPLLVAAVSVLVPAVFASAASAAGGYHESLCQQRPFLCLDKYKSIGENGAYTGHDEASVQFISNRSGTGGRT
jgi:hypothetical protein